MNRRFINILLSITIAAGLFTVQTPTAYSASDQVLASTVLGDANLINPGWMTKRMYISGYGINCSMGIGEMSDYPVQIKQVGSETICVLQNTSLVDIFIGNMNHDLAANATPAQSDTYRNGDTYISGNSITCLQLAPNAKSWILGILHKRLMETPEDIFLTLTDDKVISTTITQPASYSPDFVLSGTCTTSYKTSSANRCENIQVAASRMNITIMPGQIISVSNTFLPRTKENGYKVAHAYENGKIVDAMGGGICQVSSTVYTACRNSGLEIIQRYPHSMPVSYLPLGMDAAISAGTKDLVIRNPYSLPVIMQTATENKRLTVNVLIPASVLGDTTYKFWSEKTGPLSATSYITTYINGVEQSTVSVGSSKYKALPAE